MTVGSTLALVMPALAVYAMLARLWCRSESAMTSRVLAAALSPGLGIGLASVVYFVLLLLIADHGFAVAADAGIWCVADVWLLAGLLARRGKAPERQARASESAAPVLWRPALGVTAAGCLILLGVVGVSFYLHTAVNPHGEWDAWAIWNLRARSIARGAPNWAAVFSPALDWSNPDYPLLLPLTVARLWAYSGRESAVVPAVVAMLFCLSSLAVLVVSIGRLRGWSVGLLSGMVLLMARTYVFQSACQCADVPIGFFILVTTCFVATGLRAPQPASALLIAGCAAGLAAWTKNEGLVLLVWVVLVSMVPASRLRKLAHAAAGAAAPGSALTVFKLSLAPPNYLLGGQSLSDILAKLVDSSRWTLVMDRLTPLVPRWGAVPGGALASLGLAVALTARLDRRAVTYAGAGLGLVLAMLVSYSLVYVITPKPLDWQIATSFDRLFTQLWPTLVWAAFQLSGEPLARVNL